MDTGKRQHLQDIYATDRTSRDDFTPQVSAEVLEERKRAIRRAQFTSFILGFTVLVLSVVLVYVVVREYIEVHTAPPSPTPVTQEYIPRYSLPGDSQWVLDFSRDYGDPKWDGIGERPFSAEWIRKAAFNIILAEQAEGIGEYGEAAEYYENAVEIFPKIEGVKVALGMVYFKLKQFDKALALLENTPEADLTPDVLNNLGAACLNAEAFEKAENYLKQAIEQQPTYAEAQLNLAVLYKEQKRDDDSVAAYEKYIDLRPADIDTQHNFALYLTKLGRWEEAANILHSLTQEITDVPVLFFLLAQVETHNGNTDKAIAAIKRGVQLSDPNAAIAYMDSKDFAQLRESEEFQGMIKALEKPRK
jgi:Tfp pilus assembly protein PilF